MNQKKPTKIVTHTGEDSQPARIYFQVFKPKTLLGIFKKLRCVRYEPQNTDGRFGWRWFYDQEAKKIKFKYSMSKIPKEARPVVLGEFFFQNEEVIYLDVRSFKRVIQGIDFFRKHINLRVAKVTKIQIVNRLFSAEESNIEKLLQPPYDHFFDEAKVVSNQKKFNHLLQEFENQHLSQEESRARLLEHLQKKSPEIEEIMFDSAGEESLFALQFSLTLRNIEAAQHFDGDEQFSQWDLLETISETLLKNSDELLSSEGESSSINSENISRTTD